MKQQNAIEQVPPHHIPYHSRVRSTCVVTIAPLKQHFHGYRQRHPVDPLVDAGAHGMATVVVFAEEPVLGGSGVDTAEIDPYIYIFYVGAGMKESKTQSPPSRTRVSRPRADHEASSAWEDEHESPSPGEAASSYL